MKSPQKKDDDSKQKKGDPTKQQKGDAAKQKKKKQVKHTISLGTIKINDESLKKLFTLSKHLKGGGSGVFGEGLYAFDTGKYGRLILGIMSDVKFSYHFELPIDGKDEIDLDKLSIEMRLERGRCCIAGIEGLPGLVIDKVTLKNGFLIAHPFIGFPERGMEPLIIQMKAPANAPSIPFKQIEFINWALELLPNNHAKIGSSSLEIRDCDISVNGTLFGNLDFQLNPFIYGHLDAGSELNFSDTKIKPGISTISLDLFVEKQSSSVSVSLQPTDTVGRQMLTLNDVVLTNKTKGLNLSSNLLLNVPSYLKFEQGGTDKSIEYTSEYDFFMLDLTSKDKVNDISIESTRLSELFINIVSNSNQSKLEFDQNTGFSCKLNAKINKNEVNLSDTSLSASKFHLVVDEQNKAREIELLINSGAEIDALSIKKATTKFETGLTNIEGMNVDYTQGSVNSLLFSAINLSTNSTEFASSNIELALRKTDASDLEVKWNDTIHQVSVNNIGIEPITFNTSTLKNTFSNTLISSAAQIVVTESSGSWKPTSDLKILIESDSINSKFGPRVVEILSLGRLEAKPAYFDFKQLTPLMIADTNRIRFNWKYSDYSDPSKIQLLNGAVHSLAGFTAGNQNSKFLLTVKPIVFLLSNSSFVSLARKLLPSDINKPENGELLKEFTCWINPWRGKATAKDTCRLRNIASTLTSKLTGRDTWNFTVRPNGEIHADEDCTNSDFGGYYNAWGNVDLTMRFLNHNPPAWSLSAIVMCLCDVYHYYDNSCAYDVKQEMQDGIRDGMTKGIQDNIPGQITVPELSQKLKDNGILESLEVYSWKTYPKQSDFVFDFAFKIVK